MDTKQSTFEKKDQSTMKNKQNQDSKMDQNVKLCPKYDMRIWLRSCEKEILKPIPGTITGTIPKWLSGSLLQNGPGLLKIGDEHVQHIFDGFAMLHRFCIENGQVTYQCRYLESDTYKKSRQANRIVLTQFGTKSIPDPCHSIFDRLSSAFIQKTSQLADNSMVSIYPIGDDIYAFNEIPNIHRINPITLKTEEKVNIDDYVSIVHHTAHPHVTEDGSVYNLAMAVYPTGLHHTIIKFPFNNSSEEMFKTGQIVAAVPARWCLHPSYMHSFGLTENFFILIEQPLSISIPTMFVKRFKNEPIIGSFHSNHNERTQFILIDRETGKLICKFCSETFFYFHIINQYEIDDYVIIDVCTHDKSRRFDRLYVETLKSMQQNLNYDGIFNAKPMRFVLPLLSVNKNSSTEENLVKLSDTKAEAYLQSSGEILVKGELLCNLGCELPRINYERYLGKPYRYFYAVLECKDDKGAIIKVDTQTKTTKIWYSPNCYSNESIFIPSPNPDSEDDGVVLCSIVWGGNKDTNRVGLVVLDGKSFEEIGRAEFLMLSAIPTIFHGWFINYDKMF